MGGEEKYRILGEYLKEGHLEDTEIDGKMLLLWTLKKQSGVQGGGGWHSLNWIHVAQDENKWKVL
jgi:hypothetical protein